MPMYCFNDVPIRYTIINNDEATRCTFMPNGNVSNYQQADRNNLSNWNMLTNANYMQIKKGLQTVLLETPLFMGGPTRT